MSITETSKFSCYLIGEDNLANRCAKIILEQGHSLLGICSPSEQVKNFANQYNLLYTNSLAVFESWLQTNECDFLFSVVNSHILSKKIIKLPRQLSINYHNAPLPKYAGVHATSWAILNNEQHHGVTWHILDEGIDTGDILKQTAFKIDDQDTNFTLDIKCIDHALPLFKELLEELATGNYKRIKQDLKRRSYYTLYQKPKHWGVISWSTTASEIYALYRALNFAERTNKLCLPKFALNNEVFFAKKVEVFKKEKNSSPGQIIELSEQYLRIATTSDDITLSQITDINGNSYSITGFVNYHHLKKDDIFPSLNKDYLSKLEQHSERLAKNESFWVQTLERVKNVNFLALNSDESVDAIDKKTNIIKKLIYTDKYCTNKIAQLALINTSTTHVLITIFLLYLYRLNNYDDFSIGYKCKYLNEQANKIQASSFFASIAPINISFTPEINFHEALVKVSDLIKLVEQHETFAKDVMLRYPQLNGQLTSLPIVISATEPDDSVNNESKNCLNFIIDEENIILYLPDNLDSINQQIIDNIPGHLQVLLDNLVLNKNLSVKNLNLLTEQEKKLMLEDWNNTKTDYPRDLSIPQIFEQQVAQYPNNVALKFGDNFLTYQELNQKVNQLSYHLGKLGVKNGSLVATYFDKGMNSVLSILSVLKAGAAYTPIDPMYPQKHIKYILEDTGVVIVLTQEKNKRTLEECLPAGKFILLSIDSNEVRLKIFNSKNTDNQPVAANPTSLAYVMYTSGSTGIPKGVMINHRAIIRLVKDTDYIKFNPNDCVAQAASMSFDASTFEIWGALLNGARLVCADNDSVSNAEKFADFLQNEKISVLVLVSAVFDQHASANPAMFRYLKCLLVGGDALNVETIYEVVNCSQGSPSRVLNIYGPTENATCTTIFSIPKNFNKNKAIPIGKPIANTTVYILDKYLNPLPVGIPGELCTGGDGLALGYWHKENITKEKFVNCSIGGRRLRLYKIGDLVKWLPDGNIDYICRIDNQVKVRGFRVELEAIELCLLNCDMISQCAVLVRQDKKARQTLVAYIVAKDNLDIPSIRQILAKSLPHYMVPNVFVVMDKLPLTPNGKVDKKALPLNFYEKITSSENCVYPHNELENKLSDIWKELLNLDIVSINDNFFHLGGHSLLITEMTVKIKQLLNTNFPLHAFLEIPTIANLANLIDSQCNRIVAHNTIDNTLHAFVNDIFLDQNIQPLPEKLSRVTEKPATVLLTGVTGFLGAYLLNDLRRWSNAKIYCLIKANSLSEAYQRLSITLERYQLDKTIICSNNVATVVGDLTKPILGLDQETFDRLSEEVDYIYHCGAHVHHLYNYEMLRAANVLSTVEIIKLAVNKKNKHIHYISTLSTTAQYPDNYDLITEDFFDRDKILLDNSNGYAQTKLASELVLAEAHSRGIRVSIYRPTWIAGHKDTGICSVENNHLFLIIKGCIQMGCAPELSVKLNILPVDFVSNFIVQASLNTSKIKSRVFNLASPYSVEWHELFKYINGCGYNVQLVPVANWRLEHLTKIDKNNALYPLMSLYLTDGGITWANVQNKFLNTNTNNTKSAIEALGLKYIKINDLILSRYFDFFQSSGFMPLTNSIKVF